MHPTEQLVEKKRAGAWQDWDLNQGGQTRVAEFMFTSLPIRVCVCSVRVLRNAVLKLFFAETILCDQFLPGSAT
jgi:hypothetical protein